MKKAILFLLLFSSFASAVNVTWEPANPGVGDVVTVYAEIENVTSTSVVKLKYCPTEETCFYENMKYENGKWVAKFNATNEGDYEIAVIVDGNVVKEAFIKVKSKSTPGFEIILFSIAILIMAKIKIRK
ncbi:MAG: hypothetical protein H5T44_03575 [Thermoplasmatales archaeon]|nr:hypothetical protein [Thermoplasmatales archaeon]